MDALPLLSLSSPHLSSAPPFPSPHALAPHHSTNHTPKQAGLLSTASLPPKPPALSSLSISHVSSSSPLLSSRRRSDLTRRLAASHRTTSLPSATATGPPELRVALAPGSRGGCVYAAIAIAEELRAARPDARLLFLGSPLGMEATAVPAAGYDFSPVAHSRVRPFLLQPFLFLRSVAATLIALYRFRPQIVLGSGGYASLPICLAAAILRIRIAIQEQNSFPGLANRVIAPLVAKIFLGFVEGEKHFPKDKCLVAGNPVRLSLRRYTSKAVARSHFFPKKRKKGLGEEAAAAHMVLVLGGSGGAPAMNVSVLNMYYKMLMEHKNRYIIWQTGAEGFNEMESLVRANPRLLLTPFLHEMDMAYAAADLVVSRSGAMTCSEILTTGKPSILIPSPTAADDHQTTNAYIMADLAGSKVLTEDELDSSSLQTAIDEILGDDKLMEEMSSKALSAARPNASFEIAQYILSLVDLSTPK